MLRKKEGNPLVLPPALTRAPIPKPVETTFPTPEEIKFYGVAFAELMNTIRKGGTLRLEDPKRAGLKKGMRITGHVHETADSPSVSDPELVILDVYHGTLKTIQPQYPLSFILDGIFSLNQAVNVLQNFSRQTVSTFTKVDYVTYTYQFLFDALPPEQQKLLLSIPTEQAIINPAFSHLFYPALCQAVVWQGADFRGWLNFLVNIKAITPQHANEIYELETPGFGYYKTQPNGKLKIRELVDEPQYGLQFLLEEHNPQPPDPLYEIAVLCRLPQKTA